MLSQPHASEYSLDSGRSVARPCRRPCRADDPGLVSESKPSQPIATRLPHLKQTRLNCLDAGSQTVQGPCRQLCSSSSRAKSKRLDLRRRPPSSVGPFHFDLESRARSWHAFRPLDRHIELMPARCALIRANMRFATLGDNGCTVDFR